VKGPIAQDAFIVFGFTRKKKKKEKRAATFKSRKLTMLPNVALVFFLTVYAKTIFSSGLFHSDLGGSQ